MLLSTCVDNRLSQISRCSIAHRPHLVGESAIRVKYWEEKDVIKTVFFSGNLVLLLRVEVPVAHHKEGLEVVVLLGHAQPCVPDHISHLISEV